MRVARTNVVREERHDGVRLDVLVERLTWREVASARGDVVTRIVLAKREEEWVSAVIDDVRGNGSLCWVVDGGYDVQHGDHGDAHDSASERPSPTPGLARYVMGFESLHWHKSAADVSGGNGTYERLSSLVLSRSSSSRPSSRRCSWMYERNAAITTINRTNQTIGTNTRATTTAAPSVWSTTFG